MVPELIAETSLLVDLERETRRGREGPAHRFLRAHAESKLWVTPTIAGELAAGASLGERAAWEEYLAPFGLLAIDRAVAWEYGRLDRLLSERGQRIGTNDLWIAAAGLAYGLPVATRNRGEFERVPGLIVLGYD